MAQIQKKNLIYVYIASYRDPDLVPTIDDLLANAKHPENLRIGIYWQHGDEVPADLLDVYKKDRRFRIVDIDYRVAKGTCWARHQIQKLYHHEEYIMQLDAHHRFVKDWDHLCISMYQGLKRKGVNKPLLTSYLPSFEPDQDPESREPHPLKIVFDRFNANGILVTYPYGFEEYNAKDRPLRGRFLSGHFIFTNGRFIEEVPYDPELYFIGEEISLAVRAFTHGYDLFYPHQIVGWHFYTPTKRIRHQSDHESWGQIDKKSRKKISDVFSLKKAGKYGMGNERSLRDYEKYAGVHFQKKDIQEATLRDLEPPNPLIFNEKEWESSFLNFQKFCLIFDKKKFPETDYDLWVVEFYNDQNQLIFRNHADEKEINVCDEEDGNYRIWRGFFSSEQAKYWIVVPHSKAKGWCQGYKCAIVP